MVNENDYLFRLIKYPIAICAKFSAFVTKRGAFPHCEEMFGDCGGPWLSECIPPPLSWSAPTDICDVLRLSLP